MAGGIALFGLALLVIAYLAVDQLRPVRSRSVQNVIAIRHSWKRHYGWTYLERPLPPGQALITYRLGSFLLDVFRMRVFFTTKIEQSGLAFQPEYFIFWHLTITVMLGFFGFLFESYYLAIILIVFSTIIPLLVLPILVGRRKALIEDQLSDTLQLIGSLLKAGHGFPQALAAVTKETQPPIQLLLKKVLARVDLGGSIEDSLDEMATEVGSLTLGWAVTAIKIQREVGGNLSEILDVLAVSIRERGELLRQVKALTAEGRLSAYILLALPFLLGILLYFTNPTYMSLLWTTTPGLVMLAVAITMMIIGSIWLWRITSVEV